MLQGFVEQFTYLGIFAVLLLGSLGVPIPEEMPIIAADVHRVERWLALAGLPVLLAVRVVGVRRWHRRIGRERLDAERSEGHSPRSWEPRAVSPLEDRLALGVGTAWDGEPVHGRIPARKGEDAQ